MYCDAFSFLVQIFFVFPGVNNCIYLSSMVLITNLFLNSLPGAQVYNSHLSVIRFNWVFSQIYLLQEVSPRGFPGSPVVRIQCCQCRGSGFDPCSEN